MSILNKGKDQIYKVVGVSFNNEDGTSRQKILSKVNKVSEITFVREPNNPYDSSAVAVYADGKQVGYLGNHYAKLIAPELDSGKKFDIQIRDCGLYVDKYILHIKINPID
jgi:hypothetical protein